MKAGREEEGRAGLRKSNSVLSKILLKPLKIKQNWQTYWASKYRRAQHSTAHKAIVFQLWFYSVQTLDFKFYHLTVTENEQTWSYIERQQQFGCTELLSLLRNSGSVQFCSFPVLTDNGFFFFLICFVPLREVQ